MQQNPLKSSQRQAGRAPNEEARFVVFQCPAVSFACNGRLPTRYQELRPREESSATTKLPKPLKCHKSDMALQIRVTQASIPSGNASSLTLGYFVTTAFKTTTYKTTNQQSATGSPQWSGPQNLWTIHTKAQEHSFVFVLHRTQAQNEEVIGHAQTDISLGSHADEEKILVLEHPLFSLSVGIRYTRRLTKSKNHATTPSVSEDGSCSEGDIEADGGDSSADCHLFSTSSEVDRQAIIAQLTTILNDPASDQPATLASYFQSSLQITDLPPIPSDQFLDQLFLSTIHAFGIDQSSPLATGLTTINRWMTVCQHGLDSRDRTLKPNSVDYWVDGLATQPDNKYLDDFYVHLQTAPQEWIEELYEKGLSCLFDKLVYLVGNLEFDTVTVQFITTLIKIFAFLMKDSEGINWCNELPIVKALMLCLYRNEISIQAKCSILKLFTIIGLEPQGNRRLFSALEFLQTTYELNDNCLFILEMMESDNATLFFQSLCLAFFNSLCSSPILYVRLELRDKLESFSFGAFMAEILGSPEQDVSHPDYVFLSFEYEVYQYCELSDRKEKSIRERNYPGLNVQNPYRLASELLLRAGQQNTLPIMNLIIEELRLVISQNVECLPNIIDFVRDLATWTSVEQANIKSTALFRDHLKNLLYRNRQFRRKEAVLAFTKNQLLEQNEILKAIISGPQNDSASASDANEQLALLDSLLAEHSAKEALPSPVKGSRKRQKSSIKSPKRQSAGQILTTPKRKERASPAPIKEHRSEEEAETPDVRRIKFVPPFSLKPPQTPELNSAEDPHSRPDTESDGSSGRSPPKTDILLAKSAVRAQSTYMSESSGSIQGLEPTESPLVEINRAPPIDQERLKELSQKNDDLLNNGQLTTSRHLLNKKLLMTAFVQGQQEPHLEWFSEEAGRDTALARIKQYPDQLTLLPSNRRRGASFSSYEESSGIESSYEESSDHKSHGFGRNSALLLKNQQLSRQGLFEIQNQQKLKNYSIRVQRNEMLDQANHILGEIKSAHTLSQIQPPPQTSLNPKSRPLSQRKPKKTSRSRSNTVHKRDSKPVHYEDTLSFREELITKICYEETVEVPSTPTSPSGHKTHRTRIEKAPTLSVVEESTVSTPTTPTRPSESLVKSESPGHSPGQSPRQSPREHTSRSESRRKAIEKHDSGRLLERETSSGKLHNKKISRHDRTDSPNGLDRSKSKNLKSSDRGDKSNDPFFDNDFAPTLERISFNPRPYLTKSLTTEQHGKATEFYPGESHLLSIIPRSVATNTCFSNNASHGIVIDMGKLKTQFKDIHTQHREHSLLHPISVSILNSYLQSKRNDIQSICADIHNLEVSQLSNSLLRKFTSWYPSPYELETIKGYQTQMERKHSNQEQHQELNLASRFALALTQIPHLWVRFSYIKFIHRYLARTTKMKLGLQATHRAIKCLNSQPNFQILYELFLKVGLELSGGHWWLSSAKGFRLSSLSALQSIQGTDAQLGSVTLLDFIVDFLRTRRPDLLKFDKFDDLNVASACSLDLFFEEIKKISWSYQKIKALMIGITDDPVVMKHSSPGGQLERIGDELPQLRTQIETLQQSFDTLIQFYGEDIEHTTICDFFGHFTCLIASINLSKSLLETQKKLNVTQWKLFNPEQSKYSILQGNPLTTEEFFQRLQSHLTTLTIKELRDRENKEKDKTEKPKHRHNFFKP